MPRPPKAFRDSYRDRLDRWIGEARELAARATDDETLKRSEADLNRWMAEHARREQTIKRYQCLSRIATILRCTFSIGFSLLFFSMALLKPDTTIYVVAIVSGIFTLVASGLLYYVVTTKRDAMTYGNQVWQFSLRALLAIITILAILLGLFAFLVRV